MLTMTFLRWRGIRISNLSAVARILATVFFAAVLSGLPHFSTLASAAATVEPKSFTNVSLYIYPEYDDPRLLIMMEGVVPDGTQLPVRVRFLVPTGAEMYSAGSKDAQGKYQGGPPDRKASDVAGWDEISYDLTQKTFRVEYYDDSIKGLPDKTVAYEFRTLYPIDGLNVEFLQPARSSNLSITPALQRQGTVENLTQYTGRYTNVTVDKPLSFNITYTKPDSNPSVNPQTSSGSQTNGSNLIWMFAIAGAAIIGGGIFGYTRIKRNNRRPYYRQNGRRVAQRPVSSVRPSSSKPRASQTAAQRSSRSERPSQKAAARGVFCRKCGARLEDAAAFCKRCGTRVG